MPKIVWLTDIHLNFLRPHQIDQFLDELAETQPNSLLISGDIGESHSVVDYLQQLNDRLTCPIHFVLGNHDFYFGSIADVRRRVRELCDERSQLSYLTQQEVCELATGIGLVGHDGWADARLGDYERSFIMMNDYKLITELAPYSKQTRWPVLQAMGDEAAAHLRRVLPLALEKYSHVFVVTHVPPLREACWHEGQLSNDEWAPHFTCRAVGDAILEAARNFPARHLTVLCGHTHGSGETWPLPNVRILTGGAVYGRPAITGTWQFPNAGENPTSLVP